MKRLLTALAVAFVATIASARIADTQLFEDSNYTNAFLPSAENEDCSVLETHASQPVIGVPYPCGGFGDKYLSLDTGDATLFRTNTVEGNVYFDMAVQFTPSATELDLGQGSEFETSHAKFAIYQNASSNIVVACADSSSMPTNVVTATRVAPDTWARLTVFANKNSYGLYSFQIRINEALVENPISVENPLPEVGRYDFRGVPGGLSSSVTQVGFKGTGAVDDFVARTTDPFIDAVDTKATIAGEGYYSLTNALAEADANTVVTLAAAHAGTIPLVRGQSYKINLSNWEFGGFTVDSFNAHDALKIVEGDGYTTYEAVAGVAYVTSLVPTYSQIYYASVADALPHCDISNQVCIAMGTNVTETVYIPAGKTLYLYEGMGQFLGTFDGPGTVNMTSHPSKYKHGPMVKGEANGATLFEPTWTGTFQVGWEAFGYGFVFNDFGNANSTVELACTHIGMPYGDYRPFTGFPSTYWGSASDGGTAPTIIPAIKLSTDWVIPSEGGWGGTTTVIGKLSGPSNLTVSASSSVRTYQINSLDGYSGKLTTIHGYDEHMARVYPSFRIGNIVYDGEAGYDVCFAKTSVDVSFVDLDSTTVNSSAINLAIGTYGGVTGLYKARAAATVEGETTGYRTVEEAVAAATNNLTAATQPPSVAIYDGTAFSEEGWTSAGEGVYVYDSYVKARIGDTPYFSLYRAIAAAAAQAPAPVTIDLVAKSTETVEIPANVTVVVGGADYFECAFSGSGAIKYKEVPMVSAYVNNLYSQLQSSAWTGTYIPDYDIVSSYLPSFNEFGNAASTFEIPEGRTLSGYMVNNTGMVLTNYPTLKVSGTLYVYKVYNGDDGTNVFSKITGSGTVAFEINISNESGCYRVLSLEDWDGTLEVKYSNDQLVAIDRIVSGSGTVRFGYEPAYRPEIGDGWHGKVIYPGSEITPITPGQTDGQTYNDQASAVAAAAAVTPAASDAVATALGEKATEEYLTKFEAKVVDNGNNTYSVVVDLTDAAKTELADEATTNVAVAVASQLAEIAADATGEQTDVSVTGATPGFYYSISYGTAVGAIDTEGERVMAPASGSVTLQTPAKAADATAGFYRVNVNVAPKPSNP